MPSHVLASSALSLSPRTALRASRRPPRAARVVVAAASSSADPAKKHANATDDVVVVVDAAAAPRRRFLATALATALASSLASSGSSAIASTVFEGAYIDPNHPHCPRAVDANGVITGIDPVPFREGAGCRGYKKKNEARPISHWSPYDRVGVVNLIPQGLYYLPAFVSLRPPHGFYPRRRRLSTPPSDAYELHPDIRRFERWNDPEADAIAKGKINPWRIEGKIAKDDGSILIDFDQKDGSGEKFTGTWDGDGILFPDGNKWLRKELSTIP